MHLALIQRRSAFVPIGMSLIGLAMIVVHVALYGVTHEPHDEGVAARLFQLLMVAQLPIIAWFAIRWLPRAQGQALAILTLQIGAALLPIALLMVLEQRTAAA